jgi:hypothetical protein
MMGVTLTNEVLENTEGRRSLIDFFGVGLRIINSCSFMGSLPHTML